MKKSAAKKTPLTAGEFEARPKWVQEMHMHFRTTGAYRSQDLQRVLGDPRDVVESKSDENPFNNLLHNRK